MESIAQLPSPPQAAETTSDNAQSLPVETPRNEPATRPPRSWFNRRLLFIALAAAALGVALFVGWRWLAAAGLTSLIVGLLPCAVMCAVGVCASRFGGRGGCQGSTDTATPPVPAPPEQNR